MPCRRVYVSEKQLNVWDPIGRRNGIPPAKGAGLPSAGSQGLCGLYYPISWGLSLSY
jgi:hypothetical protein